MLALLQHLFLRLGHGAEQRLDLLRRRAVGLIALRADRRGHRRLLDLARAAERAGDQPPRSLRLVIVAGAEPGLEDMALRRAFEVEDNHPSARTCSGCGIGRRCQMAGSRLRTSSTACWSISAKPRPGPSPPMSSSTLPQGSTTRLWP